ALVGADFKMLLRVLVDERGTPDSKPLDTGGQWNRTNHPRTGPLCCLDNALGRLVEYAVIVSLQPDANFALDDHIYPLVNLHRSRCREANLLPASTWAT